MDRLDKIISSQTNYSRKDVKKLLSQGIISINGVIVKDSNMKANPENDKICIDGNELEYKHFVYLILNKPEGYISATEDRNQKTVLDLVPEKYAGRTLFPAGRLDKDTTGLLIITDDGEFVHNILAPRKHVSKTYEVTLDVPVTEKMKAEFKKGIELNDGKCKPSELNITGEYTCNVTLTEGKYHQIKRMFGCFGAKVIKLNRISIGNLRLPEDLETGDIKELTLEEKELIFYEREK